MIRVERYTKDRKSEWDTFIEHSKNGTFILKRDFMEYHSHRFKDYSLMVYFKNTLVAVLPANIDGDSVFTHGGLTYGGLILGKDIKLGIVLAVFKELLLFLNERDVQVLIYKQIPDFYKKTSSQEEAYALFLLKARNFRHDTSITIDIKRKIPYQKRRIRSINKAKKLDLLIKEEDDFSIYWNKILIPNLKERFDSRPVHEIDEILFLKEKFPSNIRQFNIYHKKEIIAGCTIFETDTVAHSQYISANDFGRKSGALDYLFDYMIHKVFLDKEYFDFGTCNGFDGKSINKGLLDWKESFGGRTFVNRFYKIHPSNHLLLDKIINSFH